MNANLNANVKKTFALPIMCAVMLVGLLATSCTFRKSAPPAATSDGADTGAAVKQPGPILLPAPKSSVSAAGLRGSPQSVAASATAKDQEKELEKISHWFEQMDSVLRESLWVLKKERAPQGKSIFGKLHRALTIEMNRKLANKSLFSCDVYSMSRRVTGASGVPQSAEAFHKCSVRENFSKFAEWNHGSSLELTTSFQGNQLSEVLGMMTSIFNPKITCKLKSNEAGLIETFNCQNLMIDYDKSKGQVLKISRFEFIKGGPSILHLRAEVLENLEPVRKIEADVPLEGTIHVTETVLKAPFVAKPVATPTPHAPAPIQTSPPLLSAEPSGPVDPNEPMGTIQARPRPAVRGGPPVPIESLGRSGPPTSSSSSQQQVPPELQEGEYHEGDPLPNEAAPAGVAPGGPQGSVPGPRGSGTVPGAGNGSGAEGGDSATPMPPMPPMGDSPR